jgi:hypothetical protein
MFAEAGLVLKRHSDAIFKNFGIEIPIEWTNNWAMGYSPGCPG